MTKHFDRLMRDDTDVFLAIANDVAPGAGQAIMEIYEQSAEQLAQHTSQKADNTPLTEADLAAHRKIVTGLHALTPDIPVVSEEDASSLKHRDPEGLFWLIDPLDGTKEFLARNGEFTVNIALISRGEPVWGVVYAPAMDTIYWGGPYHGALRKIRDQNPTLLVLSPLPAWAERTLRVVASKSHLNTETEQFIRSLGPVDLIQAGSSLKFCRIAEGEADIYPRLAPTCEWDTAAAQAVVKGAGGHVFDIRGETLRYGKKDILNPYFIAANVDPVELKARQQSVKNKAWDIR